MIKFLNDVTGGHLLLWKVLVTSVVVALAGLQVAVAARFWGRPSLIAVSHAKHLAKEHELGQVIVHKGDGTIETEFTYGEDPRNIPG